MSHVENYGLTAPYETVALFGANGQIGDRILNALINSDRPGHEFKIIAFIPPESQLQCGQGVKNVSTKTFDSTQVERAELASALKGVDTVVSALNGKALEVQSLIQDAAADAGVKRFVPSEYGMHHIYRKPGDPMGYIHPAWNLKNEANEQAVIHTAIRSGKMSFTMIGCGDFYNQDREKTWCPWTQSPSSLANDKYTLHVIGDPAAQADFTHLDDFAAFLVATLLEPDRSHNQFLNVVSDTISHNEIKSLLETYSGKQVQLDIRGIEEMHKVWEGGPESVKEDELKDSAFPVDFWFLVKGMQGSGKFVRPQSQIHNELFPGVRRTPFEKYFKDKFGKKGAKL